MDDHRGPTPQPGPSLETLVRQEGAQPRPKRREQSPVIGHATIIMKDTRWPISTNSQAKHDDNPTVRQGRSGPWIGVQSG